MERTQFIWITDAPVLALEEAAEEGIPVRIIQDPATLAASPGVAAVVARLPLAGWSAAGLLAHIRAVFPFVAILAQVEEPSYLHSEQLVRAGATAVVGTEASWGAIARVLEPFPSRPRLRTASTEPWRNGILGDSTRMRQVIEFVRLAGPRKCTVLITGETGTGKEVVARALHQASPRAAKGMVSFCCTAVPEHLLESELFGHVKGAFTGAIGRRIGRFEQAHGSTLFLDEIGDMPLDLQAKLLRVLQEREFQRLGSSETIRVDVRIVAATNADLMQKVGAGRFREDLYYRIAVAGLRMPPLRERLDDIPTLARHFLEKTCAEESLPAKGISPECFHLLQAYPWPGNVRQLENAVQAAVVLSGEREILYPSDFAQATVPAIARPETAADVFVPEGGLDFDETLSRIERSILEQALRQTNGNKKMAADLLGLKRTTLAAKLRSLASYQAPCWSATLAS